MSGTKSTMFGIVFSSDFTAGAAAVVGLGLVYQIWSLFQFPSVASIEKKNQAPMKQIGDDSVVTVWGFDEEGEHKHWKDGISDDSPYVSRVEAYVRLIQQPFVKKITQGITENPRGKVPFANIKGTMVDDSTCIIETIKNTFNVTVDDHLTQEQKTTGHLIQALVQGSLYWVNLHQKFGTEFGRQETAKDFRKNLPPIIVEFIIPMVFRAQHANLHGCGIGRNPHADIVKRGQADIRALSNLLGTQKFFFGDKPTSYDTDVYSTLALLFYETCQTHEPWMAEIKTECANLVDHTERMKKILYPKL